MLSAEFRLAADCCRRAFDPSFELKPITVDWRRFVRFCRRHRVQGLVYEGLHQSNLHPPATVSAQLQGDAAAIVANNLDILTECGRIRAAFEAQWVPILFLKGLALAGQLYPKPLVKHGWDIDLLVSSDRLQQAATVLAELGYSSTVRAGALTAWHGRRKESPWSDDAGHHVELHTALSDNPALLTGVGFDAPATDVSLPGGIAVPTLTGDALFAYLCVHGTGSTWFRLKWLADLAALLRDRSEEEIARLHARSVALGGGRTAAVALILAHAVFETRVSPALLELLNASTGTRLLARLCQRQWRGRQELTDPTALRGGTLGIHFAQLLLAPGAIFAVGEAWRQFIEIISRARDGQAAGEIAGTE